MRAYVHVSRDIDQAEGRLTLSIRPNCRPGRARVARRVPSVRDGQQCQVVLQGFAQVARGVTTALLHASSRLRGSW